MTTKEVSLNEDLTQPPPELLEKIKYTSVTYRVSDNTGSGLHESLELTATIPEGLQWEVVHNNIREQCLRRINSYEIYCKNAEERYQLQKELRELRQRVQEARADYEKLSKFFTAQGIEVKAYNPPEPSVLLLSESGDIVEEPEF